MARPLKVIKSIVSSLEVQRYFEGVGIHWRFTVPRAPWWGGLIERLVFNETLPKKSPRDRPSSRVAYCLGRDSDGAQLKTTHLCLCGRPR